MTVDDVVYLGRDAIMVTLMISAPMLISGLIIGLIIAILQSVTQVQEITLTFVPKIIVVLVMFVVFLPWMINIAMGFVEPIFGDFHSIVGERPAPSFPPGP